MTHYLISIERSAHREHLTTAITLYREMDVRFLVEQAERDEGALHGTQSDRARHHRVSDILTALVASEVQQA
jgi:hypothetical protein